VKIKLPKLCQGCSAEFWVDDVKELEWEEHRAWITCPICKTKNLVYMVPK